jgi:hypothetical protein
VLRREAARGDGFAERFQRELIPRQPFLDVIRDQIQKSRHRFHPAFVGHVPLPTPWSMGMWHFLYFFPLPQGTDRCDRPAAQPAPARHVVRTPPRRARPRLRPAVLAIVTRTTARKTAECGRLFVALHHLAARRRGGGGGWIASGASCTRNRWVMKS